MALETSAQSPAPVRQIANLVAQYVGRLHREHEGKGEVRVYDYVDANVPVLARMAAKRRVGYKALGYTIG